MIKKNLFYNAILSVSQFIFPLVTFPYSSRILGPGGIGSVNFIDSFTQYFILFAALGIPLYGIREISKQKGNQEGLNKVFSEIFLIHIVSAILFSIIYLILALSLPTLRGHMSLVAVGIIIIISGVLSAEWMFQGMEQFSYITSRSLIVRCLSVVFLFVFLRHNSPFIYYAIMGSGIVCNGFINIFYLRKLVTIRFTDLELKKHIKPLFIILGSNLAVSVYLLMDNVILGFMKGDNAVGIYATALRIVRLPLAFISAINYVIIPQVSRAYDKLEFDEIKSLANKSFAFICVIGFPITIGMYVASSFLIQVFAGSKFESSVIALEILAPLVFIIGIANLLCVQLLTPMGKERYLLKTYFVSMVFSLLTNILLIKFFSFIGASVGMILTETLSTALLYYYLMKSIKISFDLKILSQCLIGSLLFFGIAYLVRGIISNFMVREIVVIVTCALFYTLFLAFLVKNVYIDDLKKTLMLKFFPDSSWQPKP